MYISVNKNNEIKQVGVTTDPNLTSLYVDENNVDFPFKGWSEAKICCYKVTVSDGIITMMTPYIDSRLLDHFDQVGKATETNADSIDETNIGLMETFEETINNSSSIDELELALEEVYEMISEV